MSWALVLVAPPEDLEIRAAQLFDQGALGVELQEPGMALMPGTPPLPEGCGRAIAHFASAEDASESARLFGAEPPVEVPERDWSVAWRTHHRPMQVGPRSWVHPPWEKPPRPGVAVAIDPGMAFGTGSGVIALLAKMLGAGRVVGTENDPVSLEAARQGAALNGIDGVDWVLAEDPAAVPGRFKIVIANILLNTLEELAPAIAGKVADGGRLVLSGLLAAQGDAAERAYVAQGLRPVACKEREGWLRVELSRP